MRQHAESSLLEPINGSSKKHDVLKDSAAQCHGREPRASTDRIANRSDQIRKAVVKACRDYRAGDAAAYVLNDAANQVSAPDSKWRGLRNARVIAATLGRVHSLLEFD